MKITIGSLKKLVKEAFGESQASGGQTLERLTLQQLEEDYPDAVDALMDYIGDDWRDLEEEGTFSFEIRDFHGVPGDGGELVMIDHDQYDAVSVFNGDTWEELDEDTILGT